MNSKEFNVWLIQKNANKEATAEYRIQQVLDQIKRLADGEDIDIVLEKRKKND